MTFQPAISHTPFSLEIRALTHQMTKLEPGHFCSSVTQLCDSCSVVLSVFIPSGGSTNA